MNEMRSYAHGLTDEELVQELQEREMALRKELERARRGGDHCITQSTATCEDLADLLEEVALRIRRCQAGAP